MFDFANEILSLPVLYCVTHLVFPELYNSLVYKIIYLIYYLHVIMISTINVYKCTNPTLPFKGFSHKFIYLTISVFGKPPQFVLNITVIIYVFETAPIRANY